MTPDQTRARILEAADGLFGTLGFDATTTRDIAERSGVNKALIHYHYGSKDELLAELLDGYYARLGEALAPALTSGGPVREQMDAVLDAYGDFLAANLTFCRIVQREVASGRHMERIVERTLPTLQLGVDWLSRALPRPPAGLEAAQLLTSIYGIVVTYFTHGEVLRRLTGADPFTPKALAARKRHVRTVAGLMLTALTKGKS
ncbi:MAG: TetR/AcrR family transcriptional regulator [Archangium sp.]|nr:TetR/AcrR family transcriptional regulator [Archangium sp.]